MAYPLLFSIAILLIIYILWKKVFLTYKFFNGPYIRFLHLFDPCYTSNTHNNLVALWAKASLASLGHTND